MKEAQALGSACHAAMTMKVYGRTRNERLVQTVEWAGEMVSVEEKRARSVPEPDDTPAGDEEDTRVFQEVETGIRTMPKGGFEPDNMPSTNRTPYGQAPDTSDQAVRKASHLTPAWSLVFP